MEKAIWIIAHGSNLSDWVTILKNEVERVNTKYPVVLSFLEEVENQTIEDGFKEIEQLGVNNVIVIRLFISSGSKHIKEIERILSHYKDKLNFIYTPCLDDHRYVFEHIGKLATNLTDKSNEENVLIIAHGSRDADNFRIWEDMLNNIIHELEKRTGFQRISYATFLPNTIKNKLDQFDKNKTTIVIPLFLSKGIFTDLKIPKAIMDYNVKYNGTTYLDEGWVHKWIEKMIEEYAN